MIPTSMISSVLALAELIYKMIAAGDDEGAQEAALMDAADHLAEELARRKFGNG